MKNLRRALLIGILAVPSLLAAAGAQSLVRGKHVFIGCAYCHGWNGSNGPVGPSLQNIVGRKAGIMPNFPYSAAMKNSGITWDESSLASFLANPAVDVPGTRMQFPGVTDADDLEAVVDYLKTLK